MLLPRAVSPAMLATFTTAPRPEARRCGAAARVQRNRPTRLVDSTASHSASSMSSSRSPGISARAPGVPALLTSRSSRPRAAAAASTIAASSPGTPIWPGAAMASIPSARNRLTASVPRGSPGRKLTATRAPPRPSMAAVA